MTDPSGFVLHFWPFLLGRRLAKHLSNNRRSEHGPPTPINPDQPKIDFTRPQKSDPFFKHKNDLPVLDQAERLLQQTDV